MKEEVQVQDFALNSDAVPTTQDAFPSSLKAGEANAGEPGKDSKDSEDADNDSDDSDDISPGGHHHSPGFARRLRKARRDVRRGMRARNGAGSGATGVEMAAGREREEEKEKEEEEEHGLAEVFERFRTWKWSGQ